MDINTVNTKNAVVLPKPASAGPPTTAQQTLHRLQARPPKHALDPVGLRWTRQAQHALGSAGYSLVQASVHLQNVKKSVHHVVWADVVKRIRLDQQTLRMLLKIAGHKALTNPHHESSLPFSLPALYALAQARASVVEEGLWVGAIYPQMTEAEAKEFVRNPGPKLRLPRPARPVEPNAPPATPSFSEQLQKVMQKLPAGQRKRTADLLKALAEGFRSTLLAEVAHRMAHISHQASFKLPRRRAATARAKRPRITLI